MLTVAQCEVVAYIGDGFIVCPECARDRVGRDEDSECWPLAKIEAGLPAYEVEGLSPIIEYTASSEFEEGLWCEDCGTEIVEPCMVEVTWTLKQVVPKGQEDDLDWDLRHRLQGEGYNIEGPELDYV